MSVTVILDAEAEANLVKLQESTGLPPADVVKKALASEIERFAVSRGTDSTTHSPWEYYKNLDLGPGGDALAPAREAKQAIREILSNKHRRKSK